MGSCGLRAAKDRRRYRASGSSGTEYLPDRLMIGGGKMIKLKRCLDAVYGFSTPGMYQDAWDEHVPGATCKGTRPAKGW